MCFGVILSLVRQCRHIPPSKMLIRPRKTLFPQTMTVRGHKLIPASQYDIPISPKFKFPSVMYTYWETIPLFVTNAIAMALVVFIFGWNILNKVDAVYKTHSRANISRTMDLRNPTVHKLIIINQVYKPWPEMQDVLDRMKKEECNRYLKASVV